MASIARAKFPTQNKVVLPVSYRLKTVPGSRCPLSHAQVLFGESLKRAREQASSSSEK